MCKFYIRSSSFRSFLFLIIDIIVLFYVDEGGGGLSNECWKKIRQRERERDGTRIGDELFGCLKIAVASYLGHTFRACLRAAHTQLSFLSPSC